MERIALCIGNSDGIGLAVTRRLLAEGWRVVGLSRSPSPIQDPRYAHVLADVAAPTYPAILRAALPQDGIDVCLYAAGIGEAWHPDHLALETKTFEVNLMGLVHTLEALLPSMLARRAGHIIGLSSLADELTPGDAPAYAASKAAVSSYLMGLARTLKPRGIAVTTLRFGFVDTKMAKGPIQPFKLTLDQAADQVMHSLRTRPRVRTVPRRMIPLVKVLKLLDRLKG